MRRPKTGNQNQTFTANVTPLPNDSFPTFGRLAKVGLNVAQIKTLGNQDILCRPLLGLCCSTRCPGDVIVKTYDLARVLRDAEIPVISGFHSPMEAECLKILLRGRQPVAACIARCIPKRLPSEWRKPMADGRLLVMSPFSDHCTQPTAQWAAERNRVVAAISQAVFVSHSQPASKTASFCEWCLSAGITVLTFLNENAKRPAGLQPIAIDELIERFRGLSHSAHNGLPIAAQQDPDQRFRRLVDEVYVPAFIARVQEHGIPVRTPDGDPPSPEAVLFFQGVRRKGTRKNKRRQVGLRE